MHYARRTTHDAHRTQSRTRAMCSGRSAGAGGASRHLTQDSCAATATRRLVALASWQQPRPMDEAPVSECARSHSSASRLLSEREACAENGGGLQSTAQCTRAHCRLVRVGTAGTRQQRTCTERSKMAMSAL